MRPYNQFLLWFDNNNSFNEYITPDFKVTIKNNSLELSTTKTQTKEINVSSYYKNLLQNTKDAETKDFLKIKIEHAGLKMHFEKSLL